MEIAVLTVAALCIAGAVAWHAVDVVASRRLAVRRRVLVSLRGDRAVTGVLWARQGRNLVLKTAQLLEPGNEPIGLDGDVILDRDQIEYVQAVG